MVFCVVRFIVLCSLRCFFFVILLAVFIAVMFSLSLGQYATHLGVFLSSLGLDVWFAVHSLDRSGCVAVFFIFFCIFYFFFVFLFVFVYSIPRPGLLFLYSWDSGLHVYGYSWAWTIFGYRARRTCFWYLFLCNAVYCCVLWVSYPGLISTYSYFFGAAQLLVGLSSDLVVYLWFLLFFLCF